mmetsp:Transcript_16868/g.35192  ORF Transcript_16868/g.35192 Transcript_16868/m.35192 type:complete len:108 (+) Transcript_16868:172-495(+)
MMVRLVCFVAFLVQSNHSLVVPKWGTTVTTTRTRGSRRTPAGESTAFFRPRRSSGVVVSASDSDNDDNNDGASKPLSPVFFADVSKKDKDNSDEKEAIFFCRSQQQR